MRKMPHFLALSFVIAGGLGCSWWDNDPTIARKDAAVLLDGAGKVDLAATETGRKTPVDAAEPDGAVPGVDAGKRDQGAAVDLASVDVVDGALGEVGRGDVFRLDVQLGVDTSLLDAGGGSDIGTATDSALATPEVAADRIGSVESGARYPALLLPVARVGSWSATFNLNG